MKLDRYEVDIALAKSNMSSYRQLAKRVGCSAQNLSLILNRGTCRPVTASKIATALGVPVKKIIKEDARNDEN